MITTTDSTLAGTGQSLLGDPHGAGVEAARAARAALGEQAASLVLAFASPNYAYAEVIAGVRSVFGAAPLVGASTAGQFTEAGKCDEGVVVMAIASPHLGVTLSASAGLREDPAQVVEAALANFPAEQKAWGAKGHMSSTVLVFTDGLAARGEELVSAISKKAGVTAQIVGGAAADAGQFAETCVFHNDQASPNTAAIASLFSKKKLGIGVGHGMKPAGEKMRVTRSEKTVLYEIEGKPAFDAYRDFAANQGVELAPEAAGSFMIAHEIGIHMVGNISKIRAPLSVNADGSLNMATEVPNGSFISIMSGDSNDMLSAAREAALEAKKNLGNAQAAGVILIDCICRNILLGDDFNQEIAAVREVFGEVPVVGFMTYGEIAKYAGQLTGFHNSTAVVIALPA